MFLLLTGAFLGQAFPIFFPEPFMKLKSKILTLIEKAKE